MGQEIDKTYNAKVHNLGYVLSPPTFTSLRRVAMELLEAGMLKRLI